MSAIAAWLIYLFRRNRYTYRKSFDPQSVLWESARVCVAP